MKCIIGHEITTETGFKVFEAGVDYPASDVGDRRKFFESQPASAADPPPETDEKPLKRKKITQEVTSDDSD